MWARLRAGVSRLRFAWARRRLDAEARQEMDAHLALLADRLRRLDVRGSPCDHGDRSG